MRRFAFLCPWGRNKQLGTVCTNGAHLLFTTFRAGSDNALVSTHGTHHCGGSSGVSARCSNYSHSLSEASVPLCVVENVLNNAILDRESGVKKLTLGKNANVGVAVLYKVREIYERSVSHQVSVQVRVDVGMRVLAALCTNFRVGTALHVETGGRIKVFGDIKAVLLQPTRRVYLGKVLHTEVRQYRHNHCGFLQLCREL
mmetsp:Transcript_13673/g.24373  ORF Transcript_13673/g.24373 Transcript_13673/m.24373 type:complete len:200 (-) Transcript_13673:340-939(-)